MLRPNESRFLKTDKKPTIPLPPKNLTFAHTTNLD